MANNLTLADAVVSANTGLDAIKRAPIVEEDTGIKCLRIQDVNQGKDFVTWGNTLVEKRNFEKFQLKESDILIARTGGSVGSNRYIYQELQAVYNNGLIRIRVNTKKHNPKFIYYLLQTKQFESHINGIAYSTSAQPNIKIRDFLKFEFKELGLNVENTISEILSSLDAKIELNRLTNQTLEQMAQALFKSWFVDFDPVIDNALAAGSEIPDALQHRVEIREKAHALQKQNPNIQPLPAATQRLFPSEFEYCCDDSLGIQGWIPKGWKISELGDFIRFANGKAIKSSDDGIYPIYGANGIIGKTTEGRIKNAVVIGRVGAYCGAIKYCRGYFWSSDNTIVATSKISERQIPHILYLLKHLDLNQYAGGAAQPLLNQTTLKKLKVPHAETDCLNQYNTFIDSLLLKQIKNTEEIEKLSSIRDTLLPKLISGEIILNKDVE